MFCKQLPSHSRGDGSHPPWILAGSMKCSQGFNRHPKLAPDFLRKWRVGNFAGIRSQPTMTPSEASRGPHARPISCRWCVPYIVFRSLFVQAGPAGDRVVIAASLGAAVALVRFLLGGGLTGNVAPRPRKPPLAQKSSNCFANFVTIYR